MGPSIARRAGALRRIRLLLIIGGVWLAWTTPAWANQPPGPQMALAEILILPLMMLLTALGGGYAVMRAAGIKRRRWLIAVAVVAIFLTGINEGLSAMLMLVFGPCALVRGVILAVWGARALRPPEKRAPHLAHASPARLLTAGLLTCLTAVALVGLNFAFVGWWYPEGGFEEDLKRLVAYELVRAKDHKDVQGQPQYEAPHLLYPIWSASTGFSVIPQPQYEALHPPAPVTGPSYLAVGEMGLPSLRDKGAGPHRFVTEFRLGPGARSFQVWIWPERFPFFPYNYLVTLPSFYGDETGQLRMIRVHKRGQRCPPDAPVYYRVRPEDTKLPSY